MENIERVCGTCYWHKREGDDWVCTNRDSDEWADFTGHGFACEEWEGRE